MRIIVANILKNLKKNNYALKKFNNMIVAKKNIRNNPRIIFADEPTSNLYNKSGKKKLVKEEGKSVIIVTHDKGYC